LVNGVEKLCNLFLAKWIVRWLATKKTQKYSY